MTVEIGHTTSFWGASGWALRHRYLTLRPLDRPIMRRDDPFELGDNDVNRATATGSPIGVDDVALR